MLSLLISYQARVFSSCVVMGRAKSSALVIGAGGHVGNAIARALLAAGWTVTACGRRRTPPLNLRNLPLTYRTGDVEAPGQLDRWIDHHDLVVDAAAPYPMELIFPGVEPKQAPFAAAEVRTAAQRLRARLIRWTLPYFEVKELIESRLLDASRRGLRVILLNPTYCLGPWDLHDRRVCTIPLLLSGEKIGR